MANIGSIVLAIIRSAGYGGLFVLSGVESAAIPIPSEIVLPFSGFLASSGQFSLWLVVLVATIGNTVGSLVLYAIGRSGGRWLLERYGKYVLIHGKDLETGDRWFQRHGKAAVFWSRMLPAVRTFISLPAGVAEMPLGSFTAFTILGSLPWNFALAYIGFKAGENWNTLGPIFHKLDIVFGALIVLVIVWYVVKGLQRHGSR